MPPGKKQPLPRKIPQRIKIRTPPGVTTSSVLQKPKEFKGKVFVVDKAHDKMMEGRRKKYNAKPASERTHSPDFPRKSKQKDG